MAVHQNLKKQEMNKLELTDEQLWLVQNALDFYSRVGAGQFDRIKDHPTFQKHLSDACKPVKEPEVRDKTPQGEILDIKNGKALINGSVDKMGMWCDKQTWIKIKDVRLSTDYEKYHKIRGIVDIMLLEPRNVLYQDSSIGLNGSWGIYNPSVDDSCRMAFDIVQVIRHERWKKNEERSAVTVDSHIHFSHRKDKSSDKIKCQLNHE